MMHIEIFQEEVPGLGDDGSTGEENSVESPLGISLGEVGEMRWSLGAVKSGRLDACEDERAGSDDGMSSLGLDACGEDRKEPGSLFGILPDRIGLSADEGGGEGVSESLLLAGLLRA